MSWLIILLLIIFNFILQSTVFNYIGIFGVVPNTALIIVVCLSILRGKKVGGIVGLLSGFLQDIMFSKTIGVNAFIYFFIGYFIGLNERKIYKENLLIPFIFTFGVTFIYHIFYYIFMYFLSYNVSFKYLLKNIVAIEIFYNSILSIPIYKWFLTIFSVPSITFRRR